MYRFLRMEGEVRMKVRQVRQTRLRVWWDSKGVDSRIKSWSSRGRTIFWSSFNDVDVDIGNVGVGMDTPGVVLDDEAMKSRGWSLVLILWMYSLYIQVEG